MIRCGGCGSWFKDNIVTIMADFNPGVYGPGYLCPNCLDIFDKDMTFEEERPDD